MSLVGWGGCLKSEDFRCELDDFRQGSVGELTRGYPFCLQTC